MRDFFHGWRRKAGCVTLVMAVAFMAGWVRSQILEDEVLFHLGRDRPVLLLSAEGYMIWARFNGSDPRGMVAISPFWRASTLGPATGRNDPLFRDSRFTWRWRFYAVIESRVLPAQPYTYFIVSYMFITVPLTLLSACLILWPPRKRSPTSN